MWLSNTQTWFSCLLYTPDELTLVSLKILGTWRVNMTHIIYHHFPGHDINTKECFISLALSVMRDVACQYWRPDAKQWLHNQYHTFWHQIICKRFRQHSSSELAAENIVILQVIVAMYIWKCFCSIPTPPKFIFKSTHFSVNFEFPVQPIFHWWNLAQCVISISCYILYDLSVGIQR